MDSQLKKFIRYIYLGATSVFVLFIAFDFSPKLHEIGSLSGKIKRARMAVKTLSQEEIAREEKSFRKKFEKIKYVTETLKAKAREVHERTDLEKNEALIIVELEEIAGNTKIDLSSIRPLSSESEGKYENQLIELVFQCGFSNLKDFLKALQYTESYLIIDQLNISKKENTNQTLSVRLTVLAVYLAASDQADKER